MQLKSLFIILLIAPLLSPAQSRTDTIVQNRFYSRFINIIDSARKSSKVKDSTQVKLAINELLQQELPTRYEEFISPLTRRLITTRRSANIADLPFEIH